MLPKYLRTFLEIIILTGVILVVAQFLVVRFVVEGTSMEPSIYAGNNLIVSRIDYLRIGGEYVFRGPKRGDIIVFNSPDGYTNDFVKRLIALPGDKVAIRNGKVYVNGEPSDFSEKPTSAGIFFDFSQGDIIVPEDSFFVLGDNRSQSSDSRRWGFVDVDDTVGRTWLIYENILGSTDQS